MNQFVFNMCVCVCGGVQLSIGSRYIKIKGDPMISPHDVRMSSNYSVSRAHLCNTMQHYASQCISMCCHMYFHMHFHMHFHMYIHMYIHMYFHMGNESVE